MLLRPDDLPERRKVERRDIERRDKIILRLYMIGVTRKQIPGRLRWYPRMTYEAVKKVIQKLRE